jgi:hypothetical protein
MQASMPLMARRVAPVCDSAAGISTSINTSDPHLHMVTSKTDGEAEAGEDKDE